MTLIRILSESELLFLISTLVLFILHFIKKSTLLVDQEYVIYVIYVNYLFIYFEVVQENIRK
jgi:hypothetical protein